MALSAAAEDGTPPLSESLSPAIVTNVTNEQGSAAVHSEAHQDHTAVGQELLEARAVL
jgi:hypothetical protein